MSETRPWYSVDEDGQLSGPFLDMPRGVDGLKGERLLSVIASDVTSQLRSSWDPNWKRWTS